MRRDFSHVVILNYYIFLLTFFLTTLLASAAPTPTPSPSPQPTPNNGFFVPGDSSHQVKLNFPFAWVGELKLPSRDEVASRDKLEFLGDLTDSEIRSELEKWTPFNNMSLGDQGRMLVRIQEFRDRRNKIAQDEAQKLHLNNLTPSDQVTFKEMFWQLQRRIDDELLADFQSRYDAKEQEMEHELTLKFSPLVPTPSPSPTKTPTLAKTEPHPTATPAAKNVSPRPAKSPTPKPASKPKLTPTPKPTPSPTPTKH